MPRFSERLHEFYRSLPQQGEDVAAPLRDVLARRRPQPIIVDITIPSLEDIPCRKQ